MKITLLFSKCCGYIANVEGKTTKFHRCGYCENPCDVKEIQTVDNYCDEIIKNGGYDKYVYPIDVCHDSMPEKMKLSNMVEIKNIDDIELFKDWKKLNNIINKTGVNMYSSPTILADGFMEFWIEWLDQREMEIVIEEPEKDKRKCEIFYDRWHDIYRYYKGDLYNDLLNRWSEYLLND